jgi:hypothetical protein
MQQLLEGAPRVDVQISLWQRPVDQEQIHVVHPQPRQALVQAADRPVGPLVLPVQLRRDEQLFAREPAGTDSVAHAHLVAVLLGRVDRAVAGCCGRDDRRNDLVVGHRRGAETDLRDRRTRIQRDEGRKGHADNVPAVAVTATPLIRQARDETPPCRWGMPVVHYGVIAGNDA